MNRDFVEIAIDRMLDLLREDDELRAALIRLIEGKARHEEWLAEAAKRRALL